MRGVTRNGGSDLARRRTLTEGEAVVIRSLLAAQPITEKERIQRAGLPSRTFEDIRQRAYSEGWVYDRYVPNPSFFGWNKVSFALAQPFAEKLREVTDRWKNDPRSVLLWRWPETLFGVFFHGPDAEGARPRWLGSPSDYRSEFNITSETEAAGIPVYFDLEASWSRLTGQNGSLAYPHSLPSELLSRASAGVSREEMQVVSDLLTRPMKAYTGNGASRASHHFLPRSHRRALSGGIVERRVFIDLARIPACRSGRIESIAFVKGELRDGAKPEQLFRRLVSMQVTPFLFAAEQPKVLFGTLAPAPVPTEKPGPRPAVLSNMREFLDRIEITRESVGSLSVDVDHRYDRLLSMPTTAN